MNLSNSALHSAQRISTAPTLATIAEYAMGHYLDEFGLDHTVKSACDKMKMESLAKCDLIKDGNFVFHTIHFYARPIAAIGEHNTHNTQHDGNISEQEHKSNAEIASNGYHHGLLILSYGDPEPSQFLLDRVEGVRFIKVNVVDQELRSGHLILIKEYNNMNISYKSIKMFIQKESKRVYNVAKNNCLHFVYTFIDTIIKKNEWRDFTVFWEFIARHFNAEDIEKGNYNQQQNHFENQLIQKKLLLEQKIKTNNDTQRRNAWHIGDKVLIKATNSEAKKSWYIGYITGTRNNEIEDLEEVVVQYGKMGTLFKTEWIKISDGQLKPYIEIPSSFLDPITSKIMREPVQILRSGVVYDAMTVQYLQTNNRYIDPITGILISIGQRKPCVERQKVLQRRIHKFIEKYNIEKHLVNAFSDVNNDELWNNVYKQLADKYDIRRQQRQIYRKSVELFYPAKFKPSDVIALDEDEKMGDFDLLQWNSDHMFISHTSIPIITCLGPSRIGKSCLLNQLLRNQKKWRSNASLQDLNVFAISNSADIAQTKGAWISLYGEIADKPEENQHNDENINALIDQWPEEDISMWSNSEIISWFNSLNPKFAETHDTLIKRLKESKLTGKTLSGYQWTHVKELISTICENTTNHSQDAIELLADILHKRIENRMDEIESSKISQIYLVDMEGLSHGVTQFTQKIFYGSYAISNVMLWFDDKVNSDKFKDLMKELKESMAVVANSSRKPAFMYILRNADTNTFDFGDIADEECEDILDYYIKNSDTFQPFREMNMFCSINGYQLESPHGLKRKNWRRGGKKLNKKQKVVYDKDTLDELMSKIQSIANKTKRFANNERILQNQINNINQHSSLSPEKRTALTNSKLKWFVFNEKQRIRMLQIKNAIVVFEGNIECVNNHFDSGCEALQNALKLRNLSISKEFMSQLIANKDDIVLEIKKRNKDAIDADYYSTASKVTLGAGALVAAGVFTVATGGIPMVIFSTGAAFSAWLRIYSQNLRPETLTEIKETDLTELNEY